MALWDDLKSEVYAHTNRPDLSTETDLALRSAIRTAHRAGKWWRDLEEVSIGGLAPASTNVPQGFSLNLLPNFRQIAYVQHPTNKDLFFSEIRIDDLIDLDGIARTNVYWGLGSGIRFKADTDLTDITVAYYKQPVVSPTADVNSWILTEYRDLVVLWAASTILGIIGEQEIRGRVDTLAAIEFKNLEQDSLEVTGR